MVNGAESSRSVTGHTGPALTAVASGLAVAKSITPKPRGSVADPPLHRMRSQHRENNCQERGDGTRTRLNSFAGRSVYSLGHTTKRTTRITCPHKSPRAAFGGHTRARARTVSGASHQPVVRREH